ncbi:hypothetical protein [Escherichia coli]|uniref:hypothetical protein n=1 Tax=Escherichia coli TaxID=562 RepID=UPI00199C0207|nr:hypothetical protein [Escherichia coli]EFP8434585.1 hypothetical protein [Shigella flexneri]EJC6043006.1 hypothetical protein [Shigella sonnei]EFX4502791.1 hypothetical protein [Shigella flexneri]EFX5214615.1 hypothetical protein [Shigella flexneri]EFY1394570.1 hypothetical protein [Shigella flexneri]
MSEIYCIAITVIIVGYVYLMFSVITAPQKLFPILQLITLIGISSLFSFMSFKSESMWTGEPELLVAIMFGTFSATLIFYMFKILIRAFDSLTK